MNNLTISYITNRLEPKIEWFFGSLAKQGGGSIGVNVIDFHADNEERAKKVARLANHYGINLKRHITPKPTVWQGKHRLTKADYFAASNASNTAVAVCDTDWIVFVDDLSVLRPGWLNCVKEAVERGNITCGGYRKVLELEVEDGEVIHYKDHPLGFDVRERQVGPNNLVPCGGEWFFGCSFVAPVEALLKINGFDEDCDGMGMQDCIAGLMLRANGYSFVYDSRMMTWESEELHGQPGNVFYREDWGVSPNDKSHAILNLVYAGRTKAPNYFGPEGLRGLRERMRNTSEFPVVSIPENEWFSGNPLKDLPLTLKDPTHGAFERKLK